VWNFHQPDWRDQRYPFPHLNFCPMTTHADKTKTAAFGDIILEGISVKHGRQDLVDALGFRGTVPSGVLAYSGDSRDCDGLRRVASGADIFICEATAGIGLDEFAHKTGHLTPFLAGRVAADAGVRKLVLVHYSGADSPETMTEDCRRSGFGGEIHIGDDFDVLEL
jgi:ribonuclease BN (tRNA processing enzyme)